MIKNDKKINNHAYYEIYKYKTTKIRERIIRIRKYNIQKQKQLFEL
jgi:hypothetical protein